MTSSRLKLISLGSIAALALLACTTETVAPSAAAPTGDPSGEAESEETDEAVPGDETDTPDSSANKPTAKDAGTDAKTTKPDAACTSQRWYLDSDNDGFGALATFVDSCDKPAGHVLDKTDCDDTKASIKPNAVELCDAVDNDCDGKVNGTPTEAASCTSKAGTYAGTFSIYTAEKLGQTIVNQMKCTGTTTQTVDLAGAIVVKGTTTCSYPGGLGGFAKTQWSTIEASIQLDGTLEGKLIHNFDSFTQKTFTIKGKAENGRIDVTSNSSWYPHPMSAVPWEVTITIAAPKS